MKLQIFTTGGTIDKIYFDALSEFQIGEPVVGELLARFNVGFEYQVEALMGLDSLDMTDDHRRQIQRAVEASDADRILITHGTDGMVETAKWLASIPGKCIFLTGALQPAAFSRTDAVFNIGCAIGGLQSQPPGVYIAMSGLVFAADQVVKNHAQSRFEARD
ncbi:MAG: asparaginase [Porticoccaceae bacterium]|jgi:L-asparaginase|nr:asparaginase [Porticoccaceae bacterium]MBT5578539.1 asparaginase [Porticoccaceae bacterium]MBT7375362.1 asparaginase [Porticoccaceae bacterium]